MAGFLQNPRGLKPVSRNGSSVISPTTVRSYIDPVNTLSLGGNQVVVLSPVQTAPQNPAATGTIAGYINGRGADTPATGALTVAKSLNAWGVLAGVEYTIPTYPGFMRAPFWKQGTSIVAGTDVIASVIHDPEVYYEIQTNSATGLTKAMIGKYANLANINWIDNQATTDPATGLPVGFSISQGQSYTSLNLTGLSDTPNDSTGGGFVGLYDVEIIDISPRPGNYFTVGTNYQPYNYAIVKLNSVRQ